MSTQTIEQQVPAGTYAVDPVHSSISFAITHNGVATFRSGFDSYEARLSGGETPRLEGSGRRRQHQDRRGATEGPPALPRLLRRRALPAAALRVERAERRGRRLGDAARRARDPRREARGRGERQVRPARRRPRRQRPRRALAGGDRRPAQLRARLERRAAQRRRGARLRGQRSRSSWSWSRRPSSDAGARHLRQPAPRLAEQRPAAGRRRAAARGGGAGRVRPAARGAALRRGRRNGRRRPPSSRSCATRFGTPTRS